MGYYVDLTEADFIIPEREDVLEALRAMPKKYKAVQRGGSSNGEKWFSWMNDEEIEKAESCQSIFEALGFDCTTNPYGQEGTFSLDSYNSKVGQEDLFMAVVAPFVKDESYTQWRGEDGEIWRYVVSHGVLTVQTPLDIQWGYPEPFRVAVYHSTGSFEDKTFTTRTLYVDPYEDVDAQIEVKLAKIKEEVK
jgi:hypothetical protein